MARTGAFISYARADGAAFAEVLRSRLAAQAPDITVWQDRRDIEGGVGWWRQIEDALTRVAFMVIVMTPGVLKSDVTRQEWRAARQHGVCVHPVAGPGFRLDDPLLPGWMRRAHIYDLDAQWDSFIAHLRRGCQATHVPFMAPPLPSALVPRAREFDALRNLVLDAQTGDTVAITTTLAGAGGFGKTTLATALCHDDAVVSAFDDGVLWATLGQTPNLQAELTRLYAALTGERPGFVSVEDAAQALADRLVHKRCLIVVDDVWDTAHLRPFLRGGPACARLVTTRQALVAAEGRRVAVDEMTGAEAVALLAARLPVPPATPADLQPLRQLAHRLGEWPLLLRLAGAALRQRIDRGDSLDGALRHVATALDKRGVTAFDREHAVDRHEAVTATLAVSLDLLNAADRQRCIELAIFPEDTAVPVAVVAALWGLDAFDTEEALGRLHDGSLVEFDLGSGTVGLHDTMRACYAGLLGGQAAATHHRLVDAWPDVDALPGRYAWRWLGHHLVQAGQSARLRELLGRLDWLQRKLAATDVQALVGDLALLPEPTPGERLLANVLRLSSHVLNKDKTQLVPQLLARLAAPAELALGLHQWSPPGSQPWLKPLAASLVGPGGALLRTLDCAGVPSALALTPDGRTLLARTDDGRGLVWDLASGTLLHTLRDPQGADAERALLAEGVGTAFALLPDGQVLLAGSRGLARWSPGDQAPPRLVSALADAAYCLAVSPDGRQALLGSRRGQLTLVDLHDGTVAGRLVAQRLDVDTGQTVDQRFAHRLGIAAVAFSADGRSALTGSYDKTVRLWDLATRSLVDTLYPPHDGIVYSVVAAAGAPVAASAGADGLIRVWDLATQTCRATLAGHGQAVYHLALSADGSRLLSASRDRTVRLWDTVGGQALATLHGHSDSVVAVAFVPGGRQAVSAAKDGTLRVWQLEAADSRAGTQAHEGWIHAVALSADGRRAVTAGQDQRLCLWDTASARVQRVFKGHHDAVSALALNEDAGLMVSGSHDRRVLVWPLGDELPRHALRGHGDAVSAVVMNPAGTRALSASYDGDVILWDLVRGRLLRRWDAHRRAVTVLAPLPGWGTLVTGAMDGTLKLWDLARFTVLHSVDAHLGGVGAGALLPAGDGLLTGGAGGELRLWRLPGLSLAGTTASGHGARVRSVAVPTQGRWAVSAADDRYLRAWSLPSLDPLSVFVGDAAMACVAASDDGDRVVVGDAQGSTHFLKLT